MILAGLLLAAIGELGALPAGAIDRTVELQDGFKARVVVAEPGPWKVEVKTSRLDGRLDAIGLSLAAPEELKPPKVRVEFLFPQVDITHFFRPGGYGVGGSTAVDVQADWGCRNETSLSRCLPIYEAIDDNDRNRFLLASSETKRTVVAYPGLREEGSLCFWYVEHFTDPQETPVRSAEFSLRVDRRDIPFWTAVASASDWMLKTAGYRPLAVPEAAFDPLYSTWYSFHQDVWAKDIEAECEIAARLGMRTLIVDDGWQGDDTGRYYNYVGAWEVSPRRFPDIKAHVAKIHALGMKYMMWYAVPFVGNKTPERRRFEGKFLFDLGDPMGCSVLDPRFPEVREYLIGRWEHGVRDWGLDGLKLDFIDSFGIYGNDPAVAENFKGRDIKSLPEAVNRLLLDAVARLKAIRPDLLVEFRQSYVGPAIRQYGNMFRAGDCPGDAMLNRCRIANLRLTSGSGAVHADMLEWHPDETPENAAKNVLSSLFGVIQYSVMLRKVPAAHREMISHWLRFSVDHRRTLMKGEFRPHAPHAHYPVIEAEGEGELIVGVYVAGMGAGVSAAKPTYVLNATGRRGLAIDFPCGAKVSVFDTFGKRVAETEFAEGGLRKVDVPVSGYVLASPLARQ